MDPVWIKFLAWVVWLLFFFAQAVLFFLLLPFTPRFEPSTFLDFKVFIPAAILGLISMYFIWVATRAKLVRHWAFTAKADGKDLNGALAAVMKKRFLRELLGWVFAFGVCLYGAFLFLSARLSLEEVFLLFTGAFALLLLGWPENERASVITKKTWEA